MKSKIMQLVAIAFIFGAIALIPLNSVQAVTVKANPSDTAKEAAKDMGVKQQFGKSKNGDRLLDDAREEASKKLNNLAEKADSPQELPDNEKLFLKNLSDKS
jgi:hypothetical protein